MAREDLNAPFSSLIDWSKEESALEAEKGRKQNIQKRIMKANALGEAFRLISEGIGKSRGSNVVARNTNPFVLNAVSNYAKADDEYMGRLENLKTKKLALGQADIQYKIGQEQTAEARNFAAGQAEKQHSWKAQDELDQLAREYDLLEFKYKEEGKLAEAEGARKNKLLAQQAKAAIEEYRGKKEVDMNMTSKGPSTARRNKDDLQVDSPETGVRYFFDQGQWSAAVNLIRGNKTKYDRSLPDVIRDILDNKKPDPTALATALRDNWSVAKYALPEYATELQKAQFENMASGGTGALVPGFGQPPQSGTPAPQSPTGTQKDLSDPDKLQLKADIMGVLQSNYGEAKKTTQISSMIKQRYKAQGINKPISEINEEVVLIMSDWKDYVKGLGSTVAK